MKRALLVAAMLLLAGTSTPAGHARAPLQVAPPPFHVERAFTARAEAFPMETAPGTRETEVAVRQLSTLAEALNPPADAFARAATSDAGLAEAYLGQQGPSADADTATGDGERDDVVQEGGSRLEAHADPAPRASAQASGNVTGGGAAGSGTGSSASTADAASERLVATAAAEINDVAIGPLVIGSGRFDAVASADGTPGGASGAGQVVASDATFGGIPVVIGADGLAIDEARVPDALVGPTTAALQEAFSQGGFTDIRVVQPHVAVAPDGSSVRVAGGGIFVFLTNNNPAERYFVSHTLLGGSAEVAFGGVLGRPTAGADAPTPVAPPAPPAPADPAPIADRPAAGGPVVPSVGASPPLLPAVAELAHAQGTERLSLPGPWPGWVWSLVVVAAGWIVAGALRLPLATGARARLLVAADDFADRYLRG